MDVNVFDRDDKMTLRPLLRDNNKKVIFEVGHSGEWFMRIYEDGFIDFNLELQRQLGNSGLQLLLADSLMDNINLHKCKKCGYYERHIDNWSKAE